MTLRTAKKIYFGRDCGGRCHNWQQIEASARLVGRAVRRGSRLVSTEMIARLNQEMDDMDRRLSDEALAEMREKGESPIAWEEVKQRLRFS